MFAVKRCVDTGQKPYTFTDGTPVSMLRLHTSDEQPYYYTSNDGNMIP